MIDYGEHSYRGRKRLEGLTALVTDADAGLGPRDRHRRLRAKGPISGSSTATGCRALLEAGTWVRDAGRRAALFECDLAAIEQHERLAERSRS